MKKELLIIGLLIFCQSVFGQDESFETTVPADWSASLGTLSISSDHYKLDDKSLKWDWSANDVITVSNLQSNGLVASEVWDYYKNRFRIWIYNTNAIANDSLVFEFYDNTNTLQFYYTFKINFTGWRAGTVSYRYDMSGTKASTDIVTMKIKAPITGSGTFYLDYIDYTLDRQALRKPDNQLPFIETDGAEHWQDELYFQTLTKTVNLQTPTAQELTDLVALKTTYDALVLGDSPVSSDLSAAVSDYNTLGISYSGGIVQGVPLFGADYSSSQNIEAIDDFIYVFAKDYKHNNTASSLTYFINTIRYILDQGYAEGSLLETTHHIGYDFRNVSKAIHLMKTELEAEGLWSEAQKMVEWYLTLNIIWHPTALESNMDEVYTNLIGQLGAALYKDTDDEKVQYLKGLKLYLENWLTTRSQEGEGLKVDYTGFHHNTYYPGYSFGAFRLVAEVVNYLSDTEFSISTSAFDVLKKTLLVARITLSEDQIPNSLTGRHPFANATITNGLEDAGLALPIDTDLLKAYNKITGGGNSNTSSHGQESLPNGFWQINFGNLGVYRQADWVANIKGFNNYFWGAEIYSADGRYSRYQSYGSIEIMPDGGLTASGFDINGWNWNMPPNSTTIHLPWTDLVAISSRQDEETDSKFAASLRFGNYGGYIDANLEGTYGVFGMDFQQKAVSATHNASFTFKKSVFCIDGKLICLGSDINNDDAANGTATNLFQNALTNTSTSITINNTEITTFPYSNTLSGSSANWILDAINTGYYIANGDNIEIDRQNQTSPNENGNGTTTIGDFATAYLNHGTAPSNKTYEYVIIPETTKADLATFSSNMSNAATAFYTVLQQDATAHIIKKNSLDLYGYALFQAGNYTGIGSPLLSNDEPCLVMLEDGAGGITISVVNPDLNFATDGGVSQAITITLVIEGDRTLTSFSGGSVTSVSDGTNTTLTIDAKDGLPVDIVLSEILPVELLSFTGNCLDENKILLEWKTANEQDHQAFFIERSTDAKTWEIIEQIEGAGNSFEERKYNFIDHFYSSEITYYRLKDVDLDGMTNYLSIISVDCFTDNQGFMLVPNPAQSNVRIAIEPAAMALSNELLIIDDLGRVIQNIVIGNVQNYMISLSNLPSGNYYVLLKNAQNVIVRKLVKF